jgi:CubicO group peptidase (beta-lactamase class C family)
MEQAIHPKKKRNVVGVVAGIAAIGLCVALVALAVIPRFSETVRPDEPPYWPTDGWQTALPETQGVDSAQLAEAMLAWREQAIPIHSLLLIRNGYVVADATFYPYDGQSAHDVASITKSVLTTLIGIAVDQDKLSLDDKVVSFFPDRTIANLDARKEAITVRHLASMSSGLNCIRDDMANNSVGAMVASPDFVQFVLDLPMAWEPGRQFAYCSAAFHPLSAILQQTTGMTTLEFARQNLFGPLGIDDVTWGSDPQGYHNGWADMALHPQDMAKIGLLFLQEGQWDGQQIVSREWVEEATAPQMAPSDESLRPYGYGWWIEPDKEGAFLAGGRLGQYIIIYPEWDMILVATGGGFDIEQIDESLLAIFTDMENPLPANPEGVARLKAAIADVAQPPAAEPVPPLSDVARAISGQTYLMGPNPLGLGSLTFELDGSAEAIVHFGSSADANESITIPIGLDGIYRFTSMLGDGRPAGIRGHWVDPHTFVLESYGVISNQHMEAQFHFQGDGVEVTLTDLVNGTAAQFNGQLQEP